MPAFYVWNPYVAKDHRDRLSFVVTNGVVDGIAVDRKFINQILTEIGVSSDPKDWTITPYRSSYYSEYTEENDWRDVWQPVWKVEVVATSQIEHLPAQDYPWTGTNATGDEWLGTPADQDVVGCLLVSDFETDGAMHNAELAIRRAVPQELLQRYSVGSPRFDYSEVLGRFKQLHIDLGRFPGSFFTGGAEYARFVENICLQAGGIVHHESHQ